MSDPRHQALAWLDATYRGLVELAAPEPVAEDVGTWRFACRSKPQPGYPATPMLAATLVVPKDGSIPFHPAADDPQGDVEEFLRSPFPRTLEVQSRKLNSRGCAVAVGSAVNGAPASPLPWAPSHEAPGWWDLLLRRYFRGAAVLECADWNAVIAAAREPGPGTQGLLWLRRETAGVESTGHLLYIHNNDGNVVLLDGLANGLARMEAEGVRGLTFARCIPADSAPTLSPAAPPWRRPADGFAAAVGKAEAWFRHTYAEPVALVAPGPDDERRRGWLFACNTRRFLEENDWTHAMLDAALVVPKSTAEPFHLPNSDPWMWLDAWDRGDAAAGGALPPRPGAAAWFHPTLGELGRPLSASEHAEWGSLLAALSAMPVGARTLIWARRADAKGRETVGLLLTGLRTAGGNAIIDSSEHPVPDLNTVAARSLHLIRYR